MSGPERITASLLAVLHVLLGNIDHESHGWQIMKMTGLSGPTTYRILERLSGLGWVSEHWEQDAQPGRPRRRYYRLTGVGEREARALLASRAYRHVMSRPAFGA